MDKNYNKLKYFTVATTVLSALFLYFNWFTLSVPMMESFLESASFSVSFVTLPALIEENALGLITRMGGKSTAITALLLCGILKYLCVLSTGLGLWGIWKMCVKEKRSRLIFASQLIALALQLLSFLLIILINVFISGYADSIAANMNMQEGMLEFNFTPTLWLCLSTLSAIGSLVVSGNFLKRLK